MRWSLCLLMLAPLWGADLVVLRNGTVLDADRIERTQSTVVLHRGQGRIEFESAEVDSVEFGPVKEVAPQVSPVAAAATLPPGVRLTPKELVTQAAERHGLPPELVRSVASAESAYRVDAVSRKGAIGVMQLMPDTARELSVDPHVTEENIDGGARFLRQLLEKYKDAPNPVKRALAAYNAGEGAVQRYDGVPPYRETQIYVERVLQKYWNEVRTQKR